MSQQIAFDAEWTQTITRTDAKRTRAMREAEVADRALLLARLGYSKKAIEARMKQNLGWEYSEIGKAATAKRVGAAVNDAMRRAGRGPKKR